MSNAIVGALRVTLGLDSAAFENGLTGSLKKLRDAGASMQKVGARLATVGAGMSAAVTAPFIALGAHLLQGSQDAAHAAGQVKAALTSMGDASGKSFDELQKSAEALRNLSGVDDDEILTKLTANMLSFGNISGEAFDRAQLAALNLSARMQGDLQGATMMVGKALNDPVKGLAALGRAGIQFTEQQKEQIKRMVAVGDAAGAQSIMLAELERQFGGAAEAAGNADAWKPLRTALMDLEGAFEPLVRDVLAPLIAKVAEVVRSFANMSPEVLKFVAIGAAVAAAIGPILVGLGAMVSAAGALTAAFAGGGFLAGLLPFLGPIGIAAAAVAAAFMLWGDDIVPALAKVKTAIVDAIGPAIPPLMAAAQKAFEELGPVFSALIDRVGPILAALGKLFVEVFGPILLMQLRVAVTGITSAFNLIGRALGVVTALLRGDWSGAWRSAGSFVMEIMRSLARLVEAVFPGITGHVQRMVQGVTSWLQGRLFDVLRGVIDRVKLVSDAFFRLYDAVVGNSFVPDMVTEVGQWMARLDDNMVKPAQNATKKTAEAFEALRDRVGRVMEGLLTEREKLDLDFRSDTKALDEGLAKGVINSAQHRDAINRLNSQYATARGGLDAEGLKLGSLGDFKAEIPGLTDAQDAWSGVQRGIEQSQKAFDDAAQKFGDDFAFNMERVLRSDIKGVFNDMLSSALRSVLSSLGQSLFRGSSGGGGIGEILSSAFKMLPGFATGGSFTVGGSGSIDSKLVAFRATPGERVDISTPGQQRQRGDGGGFHISVDKSKYFDVEVTRIAAPISVGVTHQGLSQYAEGEPRRLKQYQAAQTSRKRR